MVEIRNQVAVTVPPIILSPLSAGCVVFAFHPAVIPKYRDTAANHVDGSFFAFQVYLHGGVPYAAVAGIKEQPCAGGSGHQQITGILHLNGIFQPLSGHGALHIHYRVSGKIPKEIQGVNGLVNQHAAAFRLPLATPCAGGIVLFPAIPNHNTVTAQHFASLTAVQQGTNAEGCTVVTVLKANTQLTSRFLGGSRHVFRIGQMNGHGLFAQHMLAGLQGVHRHLMMQVMGRAHMHHIYFRVR